MCPDKKLEWFDPDQAAVVEQLVRQRWSDSYEMPPHTEVLLHPDGSPIKVRDLIFRTHIDLRIGFSHARGGLWIGGAALNNHPDIVLTLSTHTSRNPR